MEYLMRANQGNALAYGDDEWTQQAADYFRDLFETDCDIFFVFNGTAANSLSLASLCQSYHSVICHEFAHIETDECGAPELASHGSKLLLGQGIHGKLTPESIGTIVNKRTDIHYPKPRVISLLMFSRQVNNVFVKMPERVINTLRTKDWHFYTFIGGSGVRLACSWDTTQARIDELINDIKDAIVGS